MDVELLLFHSISLPYSVQRHLWEVQAQPNLEGTHWKKMQCLCMDSHLGQNPNLRQLAKKRMATSGTLRSLWRTLGDWTAPITCMPICQSGVEPNLGLGALWYTSPTDPLHIHDWWEEAAKKVPKKSEGVLTEWRSTLSETYGKNRTDGFSIMCRKRRYRPPRGKTLC